MPQRVENWLASRTEWRVETREVHEELPLEVLEEVGIPDDELDLVLERVAAMAESYCPKRVSAKIVTAQSSLR